MLIINFNIMISDYQKVTSIDLKGNDQADVNITLSDTDGVDKQAELISESKSNENFNEYNKSIVCK